MAQAQEDVRGQKLRDVTAAMSKTLECPVCLETVRVPCKMCVRGHLMCSKCIKDRRACPVCQAAVTVDNPVCVRSLLEALPRPCQYSERGCSELTVSGDEHQRYCGYRWVSCIVCLDCSLACELTKHYETKHTKDVIKSFISHKSWSHFDPAGSVIKWYNVCLFGHCFWLKLLNDLKDKHLRITFFAHFVTKPVNDYYCRVTFDKDDLVYTHTLQAVDMAILGEILEHKTNQNTMRVPQDALNTFIENGKLNFNLYFFEKPSVK